MSKVSHIKDSRLFSRAQDRKGIFITLEGGEGSGKTSAIQLIRQYYEEKNIPVVMTREPGGVEIAEQIRGIILDRNNTAMDGRTEALLYAAARRQHLVEIVVPALTEGATVVCDRFIDSSLAYQGHARGLGMNEVWSINQFAIDGLLPDMTFYLDLEPEIGLERIQKDREREMDRLDLEQLGFHHKVREGYLQIAKQYPDRIHIIDAAVPLEQVAAQIIEILSAKQKDFGTPMSK